MHSKLAVALGVRVGGKVRSWGWKKNGAGSPSKRGDLWWRWRKYAGLLRDGLDKNKTLRQTSPVIPYLLWDTRGTEWYHFTHLMNQKSLCYDCIVGRIHYKLRGEVPRMSVPMRWNRVCDIYVYSVCNRVFFAGSLAIYRW